MVSVEIVPYTPISWNILKKKSSVPFMLWALKVFKVFPSQKMLKELGTTFHRKMRETTNKWRENISILAAAGKCKFMEFKVSSFIVEILDFNR